MQKDGIKRRMREEASCAIVIDNSQRFAVSDHRGYRSFPAAVRYQTVRFRSDVSTAPCHTCLHIYSCDTDIIQQLWNNNSTPTLPLKISYAAPDRYSQPEPIPAPTKRKATTAPASSFSSKVSAPSHGAYTLAASSMW